MRFSSPRDRILGITLEIAYCVVMYLALFAIAILFNILGG
jgi:hypothetical protein